jgi:anti-anti-sigma factor
MTAEHDVADPGGGHLAFSVDIDGTGSRVLLRGELDDETAPLLTYVVSSQVAHGRADLLLDLAGLTFFDLRGFAAVCDVHAAVEEVGGRLRVVNADDLFRTVAVWWGVPELVDAPPPADGPV